MIRVMLWKEYREHRLVWLTLAVVGAGGLFGLSRLLASGEVGSPSSAGEALQAVAVLLAWTYGLVCGSMLLAGEREGATLTFLDILPVRCLQLWVAKGLIGVGLLLSQATVLTGFVVGLGILTTVWQTAGFLLAALLFGLLGLSWGLLFSARGENVLNVIGLAFGGQILSVLGIAVLRISIEITFQNSLSQRPFLTAGLVGLGLVVFTVGPIVGSARIFSRSDRLRGRAVRERRLTRVSLRANWSRLLWLSYCQVRRLVLGLSLFALALGFLLPIAGPAMWPVLTLFIGVLCGVTVYADEQVHASFRFLGDQRFPLGRIWIVKVSMRFALAVFATCLLMLPSLILTLFHRTQGPFSVGEWVSERERSIPFFSDVLHSSLIGSVIPTLVYLTIWLLYGFSGGHLCGLLFRKSLVAAVVALGGTAMLVSLWVPSMVGIGLHFLQIAGVPVILLVTAWLLMPAWAADRLVARGTFVRLGVGLTAAGLWSAGGLWYRVAEIPNVPDQFDMPAFVASLPHPENNKAGLDIRSAWFQVEKVVQSFAQSSHQREVPAEHGPGVIIFAQQAFVQQADEVPKHGWPLGASELGDQLDRTFKEKKWLQALASAADEPLGVIVNPRDLTSNSRLDKWHHARLLSVLLAARGLQLQARGNPEPFVEYLRISLALSRNLQHRSPLAMALIGRSVEVVWFPAIDRWLEKLQGHPKLLKRSLQILVQHEAELPDELDQVKAEYFIAMNTLEMMPELIVAAEIQSRPHEEGDAKNLRQAEINGAAILWRIPWEQERHRRILRIAFQGNDQQRYKAREWGGVLGEFRWANLRRRGNQQLAELRASQLKVALRLYQADNRVPAETLTLLVPRYLPAIPRDPFDGQTFRYRLSHGERIGWPDDGNGNAVEARRNGAAAALPTPTRFVPKGQGILWSVGEDGHDDGGVRQRDHHFSTQFGEDIIYLVPLPPK